MVEPGGGGRNSGDNTNTRASTRTNRDGHKRGRRSDCGGGRCSNGGRASCGGGCSRNRGEVDCKTACATFAVVPVVAVVLIVALATHESYDDQL